MNMVMKLKQTPCKRCGGSGVEQDNRLIGQKFRDRRVKLGLKGAEMARRTGFSRSYISDLEQGRRNWNSAAIQGYQLALALERR